MKNLVLLLSFILCSLMSVVAQTENRDKSVYIEFLGPSNMIGVSYDARFNANGHWGYRVGLGYTYGMVEVMALGNSKSHAFSIPAEINYLIGNGKHNFELGLGASAGIYHSSWIIWDDHYSETSFGYFFYGNIGYRRTSKSGFQFRCGITPTFNFGGDKAVSHDTLFYPYLSFGYAF